MSPQSSPDPTPRPPSLVRKVMRGVCIAFLCVAFTLSVIVLIFSTLMAGMSHHGGGNELQTYLQGWFFTGYFGFLCLVALCPLPARFIVAGMAVIGGVSLAWLGTALLAREEGVATGVAVVVMLLAAAMTWWLHKTRPPREDSADSEL